MLCWWAYQNGDLNDLHGVMAVNLRYFTIFGIMRPIKSHFSQWLKIDPYCIRQNAVQRVLFSSLHSDI